MREKLGTEGLAGLLLVVLAVALVTWRDPVIGGGMLLFLAGLALIAKGLVSSALGMFGMGR